MPLVLEGLVTTFSPDGGKHVAPMGPRFERGESDIVFELAPFQGSTTLANLMKHPEGVFHVTDDVLQVAKVLVGLPLDQSEWLLAWEIKGWLLKNACRALEFRVELTDLSAQRSRLSCTVVRRHQFRDMGCFNRARHAVMEAAILASRRNILPPGDLGFEMGKLAPLVEKTGGIEEKEAFRILEKLIEETIAGRLADRP